jgi:hypothetical protein
MDWRFGPDWKNNEMVDATWQSNQEQRRYSTEKELMKVIIGAPIWTPKRILGVE